MICRKCGNQWFSREIPMPKEPKCPECGAPVFTKTYEQRTSEFEESIRRAVENGIAPVLGSVRLHWNLWEEANRGIENALV